MKNLKKLEQIIWGLGWFTKSVKLNITLESCFECFYSRATEDWEKQVTIEIISPDEKIIKNVKVIGNKGDSIDDVAKKVLTLIK